MCLVGLGVTPRLPLQAYSARVSCKGAKGAYDVPDYAHAVS